MDRFCTNCGNKLPSGTQFCPYCGCQVDTDVYDYKTPEKEKPSVSRWIWIIPAAVVLLAGVLFFILSARSSEKQQAAQQSNAQAEVISGSASLIASPTPLQVQYPTNIPTNVPTAIPSPTPRPLPTATSTSAPAAIKNLSVGNEFYLGTYEQDNDLSNGKENIVWQVLKVENGRALAISKYGLDTKLFNDTYAAVTWETCSLRKWLNGEFYQNAFSDSEKAVILETTITNPSSSEYGTSGGNNTTDKVFLLTHSEAAAYFPTAAAGLCYPTQYAISKNVWLGDAGGTWWWLRSPGMDAMHYTFINASGYYQAKGWEVTYTQGAVRPVVWIKTQ